MRDGWHELGGVRVRTEDGAPVEAFVHARTLSNDAFLAKIERDLSMWLVWEDRWRPDESGYTRAMDLASKQPSHRVTFWPDDGAETVYLLLVDASLDGTAVAWTKQEWYGPGSSDGGVWTRDPCGWTHHKCHTPGREPGVLVVEPLGPRPVSMRRHV